VRVFVSGQVNKSVFERVTNGDSMLTVTELKQLLENSATIVLETQVSVFVANKLDTIFHYGVFLLIGHFLFLHQKLVVVDSEFLSQV
jgi:hypothetical protein